MTGAAERSAPPSAAAANNIVFIKDRFRQIVTEAEQQFSAVEIVLDDGTSYISFRGTDDTIIGWKEDFNLSTGVVPAQERAVEYMQRISDKASGMLRVGGHSKGGNIAVYAATFVSQEIKDRIINVYNNDGPGFCDDVIETPEYHEMIKKVHTYIPQSSVIGRLMNHREKYTVVESVQKGIMQHDLYSWQVLGTKFITLEEVTNGSEFVDKTIKEWLENVEPEKREQVIDVVFDILNATDAQTMKEIKNHIFLYSRPLKTVIQALKRAKKEGIWICGAIISPVELLDKIVWLEENCKGIEFNGNFWFVPEEYWDNFLEYFDHNNSLGYKLASNDTCIETKYGAIMKGSKTRIWDWIISHNFHKLEETVFIDDVLSYLKQAEEKGVTAYHISSFIE